MEKKKLVKKEVNTGVELDLISYNCVSQYKSIRRAIKRGHVTFYGIDIPKRPFNNRKRTKGRKFQLLKEDIYDRIK